ncbi:hypothetical protein [Desmospora profundinema]|uniref:ABC transporter permease n=1 Tax=Desmospora profundinema TaxID=1571184 RepID=A0ABU1IMW1_9BACL|nr:hypothetical protein [Desmospora profundinema]MDR6225299.1 hypothetical protein [Desmospora profundinema]
MNSVTALWKKDFRLNAPWVLGGLLLIVAIHLLILLTVKTKEVQFALSLAPFFFHAVYFPLYLFISLQGESKQMHQWLHTPHSASVLLLSKVINGAAALFVSASIAAIYPLILFFGPMSTHVAGSRTDIFSIGFQVVGYIWIVSVQIGLFVLAVWSIYRWLKTYINRWTWVLVVVLVFTWWWGLAHFMDSTFYEWLTQWGPVVIGTAEYDDYLHLGKIVFEGILGAAYFGLAAWLLERKVEV